MDRDTAIDNFKKHVDISTRLPFITSLELKKLYGDEVVAALEEMERINREKMICQQCDVNCCHDHGCEFYAPQFTQCPIHDLRPAICRFHFCERFQIVDKSIITELSEIFLYGLSFAAASGCTNVKFFNPPPFANMTPEVIQIINPIVNRVRSADLEPEDGQRIIKQKVMQYYFTGELAL